MSGFFSGLTGLFQRRAAREDTQSVNDNDTRRMPDLRLADPAKNEALEVARAGGEAKSDARLAQEQQKRHAIMEENPRLRKFPKTNPPHDAFYDAKQSLQGINDADDDLYRKPAVLPPNLKPLEHPAKAGSNLTNGPSSVEAAGSRRASQLPPSESKRPASAITSSQSSGRVDAAKTKQDIRHHYDTRMARRRQDADDTCAVQPGSDSADEQENEGIWDLIRCVIKDNDRPECRVAGCTRKAVAIWASDKAPNDEWPVCEPCQDDEFDGWPEGEEYEDVEEAGN